jgi:hypothetical protein
VTISMCLVPELRLTNLSGAWNWNRIHLIYLSVASALARLRNFWLPNIGSERFLTFSRSRSM